MVSPSVIDSYYPPSCGFRRVPRLALVVYKVCGADGRKLVLVTVAESKSLISRKEINVGRAGAGYAP